MIVLQHLLLPEPDRPPSPGTLPLYLRTSWDAPPGGTGDAEAAEGVLALPPGGTVHLDTYHNLLNARKWQRLAAPATLHLTLRLRGAVRVRLRRTDGGGTHPVLERRLAGPGWQDHRLDLSAVLAEPDAGVLRLSLQAGPGGAALAGGRYWTADPPPRRPRLALVITTFRREAAVRATAARIDRYLRASPFGDDIRLFVIDNGDSAQIDETDRVRRLANRNLGGAGGFSRGLLEAQARGFTHALFMDDDAAAPLEALHRTYALLSLARDPSVAVAGAMVTSRRPWRMWENGAVFDGRCRPRHCGTDLRDPEAVVAMELASADPPPRLLYGGWWFFAFPLAAVERYPFPFFVRGDDVNFSLSNRFRIVTLNGVASEAEDFTEKESPLNWYLDLRSHMVHHLTLPALERGALRVARIGVWFFLRNILRLQYETAAVVLLAWADVMRGPDFFDAQADMAARRATIRAMTPQETWRPVETLDLAQRVRFQAARGWKRQLLRLTGNGHLLPFFARWGNRVVIPAEERGLYRRIWGASRIVYLNGAGDAGYALHHSKARFLRLSLQMAGTLAVFLWRYRRLRAAWRRAHPGMTSADYWRRKLGVDAACPPGRDRGAA